jgi:hypothetical protein
LGDQIKFQAMRHNLVFFIMQDHVYRQVSHYSISLHLPLPCQVTTGNDSFSGQFKQRNISGAISVYRQPLSGQVIIPFSSGFCKRRPWRLIQPLRRAGTPSINA